MLVGFAHARAEHNNHKRQQAHALVLLRPWPLAPCALSQLSLSTEEQLADWNPSATSGSGAAAPFGRRRSTDPRAVTDRRGTTAAALAAARGFAELAAALDPDRPLAAAINGESALMGRDGRELRPPAMFVCPITQASHGCGGGVGVLGRRGVARGEAIGIEAQVHGGGVGACHGVGGCGGEV